MLKNMQEKIGYLRETQLGSFIPVLLALIAIWVYFGIVEPVFLSPRNFYFLFMQSAVVGTLAVGVTLVLLMGDIDLSIATVAGVCAAIVAVLSTNMGVSAPIACLVGLGAGALLGGIMGNEILDHAAVQNVANLPTLDEARTKIVSILATPASKFVSILLARSEKMGNLSPEISEKTT